METMVERPAALDVHKAQVMACVGVPDRRGGRGQHVREFPTTVRGLLALRDGLAGHGVGQVVMEATGVDWKTPRSRASLVGRADVLSRPDGRRRGCEVVDACHGRPTLCRYRRVRLGLARGVDGGDAPALTGLNSAAARRQPRAPTRGTARPRAGTA
jgi:hypothetical protein